MKPINQLSDEELMAEFSSLGQGSQQNPTVQSQQVPQSVPQQTASPTENQSVVNIPMVPTGANVGGMQMGRDPIALKVQEANAMIPVKQREAQALLPIQMNEENAKELGKQRNSSDLASNEMMGLLGNLTSNLKAANIEAGGAGPAKGVLSHIAMGLGLENTGNIYGLKGTVRDTAIKMAQRLSGGNRGAQTIFQKVLESIPTNLNSEGQQASTINDMAHTALTLQKAVNNIGIDNLVKMKSGELHDAISANALDPNESDLITQAVAEMLKNTRPRPNVDMSGNISDPQTNPLNKMINPIINAVTGQNQKVNLADQARAILEKRLKAGK